MGIRATRGFVALDIFWILVLLGLVVVLSARGIVLVEKRDNAGRLQRELAQITKAVERLAMEEGLQPGEKVPFSRYSPFVEKRAAKRLREEGKDPLGGNYGDQVVGQEAVPDPASVKALGKFWK